MVVTWIIIARSVVFEESGRRKSGKNATKNRMTLGLVRLTANACRKYARAGLRGSGRDGSPATRAHSSATPIQQRYAAPNHCKTWNRTGVAFMTAARPATAATM